MANLATRCTACGTVFRVVRDQLRVAEGLVRCGRCGEVFNAAENLVAAEELLAATPSAAAPAAPADAVDLGLSVPATPAEAPPSPWANLDLADPPAAPPPPPDPDDFDLALDGVEVPPPARVSSAEPELAAPAASTPPAEVLAEPAARTAAPAADTAAAEAPSNAEARAAEAPTADAPTVDAQTTSGVDLADGDDVPPWAPSTTPGAWAEAAAAEAAAAAPAVPASGPVDADAADEAPDTGPDTVAADADAWADDKTELTAVLDGASGEVPAPAAPEAVAPAADAPAADVAPAEAPPAPAWDDLDLRAERDLPGDFALALPDLPDLRAVDLPPAPAEAEATTAAAAHLHAVEPPPDTETEPEPPQATPTVDTWSPSAEELADSSAVALSPVAQSLEQADDAEAPAAAPPEAPLPLPSHPTVDDLTPSFLQGPPPSAWDSPGARRSLAAACVVATVALLAQGVYTFRDALAATVPALQAPLTQLCVPLDCRVSAERHLAGLAVDGSSLLRIERSNLYQLQLTVRNRSLRAVAVPALDLTLNNAQGQVVARRMVTLAELGVTDTTLAAGRALQVQATLQTLLKPAESVAGYTLDLFYP